MSTLGGAKRWDVARFRDVYRRVLGEYVETGGEGALGRAGEIGRQALHDSASIVEVASVHHQALGELLEAEKEEKRRGVLLRAGAEFLAECLFPYEMAHRGFQDVLQALRQVNETLEGEIKRIAYAVHDEAGQLLVAVHLALADVARELPRLQQKQIEQVEVLLNQVGKHLRQYSHELRPTILDDLGWIPAIRSLADSVSKRTGIPIHIQATVPSRLPGAAETALYRVMQEALTNVVKHANANNVWISAWNEGTEVCCSIKDDGSGFVADGVQPGAHRQGLGLIAMRERVSAVGGTLQIDATPGRGTELSIRIPLEGEYASAHPAGR
jgi:signal transduction histidine kinase